VHLSLPFRFVSGPVKYRLDPIHARPLSDRRMNQPFVEPAITRRQRKDFLQLPWKLHGDDPNWVPPLRLNQKELVGYKRHPFYERNQAQTFVAYRDGAAVGRIAAIVNTGHNERHDEQRGFFGFFESIDDQQIAGGLLDAAAAWLLERGQQAIRGPANPSLNYEVGLLVEGFDSPPLFMMTYNPPYYARLLESWGLEKAHDMFAFWGHVEMLAGLDEKLKFIVEGATERFDVHVRPMDTRRFVDEVRMFLDVYNQSMAGTWGFVPLSDAEIRHMAAGLKHLIVPELALVGEVEGKPVGAVFALLDYNPRIKAIDGRLFPFGFFRLLAGRRQIKRMRVLSTNVVPEYQRWGLGLVLLDGLLPKVMDWGIEEAEFSWVLESNHLSRKSLERGGAKLTKTYRIYDREL